MLARVPSVRRYMKPLAAVLVAVGIGWVAGTWTSRGPSTPLRIEGQIEGIVTTTNYNSSGICIASDADHHQTCSVPLQVPGSPALKTGDHIVVVAALVDLGGGSGVEVYIVTTPTPTH